MWFFKKKILDKVKPGVDGAALELYPPSAGAARKLISKILNFTAFVYLGVKSNVLQFDKKFYPSNR